MAIDYQKISIEVMRNKYMMCDYEGNYVEKTPQDIFNRVANELALNDEEKAMMHRQLEKANVPAGRVCSNLGALKYKPKTSVINCTVSDTIEDSMEGIFDHLGQNSLTLKAGCGVGTDFTTIRPKGAYVKGVGAKTSGPVSYMRVYNSASETIESAGARRVANMGAIEICHPDVLEFVKCKSEDWNSFKYFNLSVLVTDEFMEAKKKDLDWDLYFPASNLDLELCSPEEIKEKDWMGEIKQCRVYKTVKARELYDEIMKATYRNNEPGIIFIGTVNRLNALRKLELIRVSNPCLSGDTKIAVYSSTEASVKICTLKELEGQEFQTIHKVKGGLTEVSKGMCILSKEEAGMVMVKFENGRSFKCTPDHKIMVTCHLKDLEYVEASKLPKGARLTSTVVESGYKGEGSPMDLEYIVESVEFLEEKEDVYDIIMYQTDHNFKIVLDTDEDETFYAGVYVHNCGEQYLPPSGACLLGAINAANYVRNPFTTQASFDFDEFCKDVVAMNIIMDRVVEHNGLPLAKQVEEILTKRRHGLGYYGLGTAMTMLRMIYGSKESVEFTDKLTRLLAVETYKEALNQAKLMGRAPVFEDQELLESYVNSDFVKKLELGEEWKKEALEHGLRWTHGNTIAPTGTIALTFGNNTSAGIEPSFAHSYYRHVIVPGRKTKATEQVMSYEYMLYCDLFGDTAVKDLPEYFITATDIKPQDHLKVQAAAQKWIDSSISKTINVDSNLPFNDFVDLYELAYDLGIKGTTTYRYDPEITAGIYTTKQNLLDMQIEIELEDGSTQRVNGLTEIEYDGEITNGACLLEAFKTKMYGRY